jgi:acetylornithine deacetylase
VKTIGEAYMKALRKKKTAWGAFTAVGETIWMKERGIPGLVFGPGELTMGSHGNDEYVPIEQLIDCCRVYAEMILRWCGVAEVGPAGR